MSLLYWGMTDLYDGFVAWFVCTTVLIGAIWFRNSIKPKKRYQCFIIKGGQVIVFTAFAYFGLMFLDTVIKEATGLITTNNLNYHLAPMILLTIIAILILFGSVFNAPSIRTLISFGIAIGVYYYFFWISTSYSIFGMSGDLLTTGNGMPPIYIPPLYIFTILVILEIVVFIVRVIRKPKVTRRSWRESWKDVLFNDKPLWDISAQFKEWTGLAIHFYWFVTYAWIEQQTYPWGPEPRIYDAGRWHNGPEPVAYGQPNGYGIYDMCENVHEWCADWYDPGDYAASPKENPRGPAHGKRRASRGGAWRHHIKCSRCAARSSIPPEFRYADYGFRVAADG